MRMMLVSGISVLKSGKRICVFVVVFPLGFATCGMPKASTEEIRGACAYVSILIYVSIILCILSISSISSWFFFFLYGFSDY